MTPDKDRKRNSRHRRLARGACADCGQPAGGYRCLRCALIHAERLGLPWLLKVMQRLAENRCAECGEIKGKYSDVLCRKHKKEQRIAA